MLHGILSLAAPPSHPVAPTATPCEWQRGWKPWDRPSTGLLHVTTEFGTYGPARYGAMKGAWRYPCGGGKPRLVFVNSMSDLFHPDVPESFIAKVWQTMAAAQQHTFQILTKRPERMRVLSEKLDLLPNVWLGTSVESSAYLWRLRELRKTRAAVRFASFEPLLGSVAAADLREIHWAIVGGESGPGARPVGVEWIREIQQRCEEQHVAFFFKQWGGPRKKHTGRELDGRTWDDKPVAPPSLWEGAAGR